MLANSLAIPLSNGNKKDHPDPTCDKPKATSRIRTQHKAKSGSTRETLKALLDTSNRAEARISKAREAGGGDGSNRAIGKVLDSTKRIASGEKGVPSVSRTALRVPTIEQSGSNNRACAAGDQGEPHRHLLEHAIKKSNTITATHPNPQQ